jgi:hypothetical protein
MRLSAAAAHLHNEVTPGVVPGEPVWRGAGASAEMAACGLSGARIYQRFFGISLSLEPFCRRILWPGRRRLYPPSSRRLLCVAQFHGITHVNAIPIC